MGSDVASDVVCECVHLQQVTSSPGCAGLCQGRVGGVAGILAAPAGELGPGLGLGAFLKVLPLGDLYGCWRGGLLLRCSCGGAIQSPSTASQHRILAPSLAESCNSSPPSFPSFSLLAPPAPSTASTLWHKGGWRRVWPRAGWGDVKDTKAWTRGLLMKKPHESRGEAIPRDEIAYPSELKSLVYAVWNRAVCGVEETRAMRVATSSP
jgi:hypothetical protein